MIILSADTISFVNGGYHRDAIMTDKIPGTRWLRVIAPILITCIISFMDRVNISFALPGGMEQDLGITSQMAGVANGIFLLVIYFCKSLADDLRFTVAGNVLSPGRSWPGRLSLSPPGSSPMNINCSCCVLFSGISEEECCPSC